MRWGRVRIISAFKVDEEVHGNVVNLTLLTCYLCATDYHVNIFGCSFFSEFRLVITRANFHLSPLTCPIETANVKFKLLNFLFLPHFPQLITLLFSKDILFNIRPNTVCPLAQPKHIELFFTLTYRSNHHSQFTKPS